MRELDLAPLDDLPWEEFPGHDPVEAYRTYDRGERIRKFVTGKGTAPPAWYAVEGRGHDRRASGPGRGFSVPGAATPWTPMAVERVLVACSYGINRSAFVAGMALGRTGEDTPDEGIRLLRGRRSLPPMAVERVLDNPSFEAFLRAGAFSMGSPRAGVESGHDHPLSPRS